jgi:formate hydrogenlyase transcriptional activator
LEFDGEGICENGMPKIVGQSAVFQQVLRQVETVAPTDATVLIQGETGTGKEIIAEAIHKGSSRADGPFIKVNCAAIPSGLLESELFGHERGAFTGAVERRIGRFELAHKGTLFLDEIGDIPLELQPKLLRVLQELEFERLGSSRTIHADVRLVAATHRDIVDMVNKRQFRADLFYRLSVFPVELPALRERSGDIPLLIRYFTSQYSKRMNKPIEAIPVEIMDALTQYSWPGNVRELQNFIERSIILSTGRLLNPPLTELIRLKEDGRQQPVTLYEAQRAHILDALRKSGDVIGGAQGAAARLGIPRTTLIAKMNRLGITFQKEPCPMARSAGMGSSC